MKGTFIHEGKEFRLQFSHRPPSGSLAILEQWEDEWGYWHTAYIGRARVNRKAGDQFNKPEGRLRALKALSQTASPGLREAVWDHYRRSGARFPTRRGGSQGKGA